MSGIISDNVGRATGLIKSAGGGGKILQVQTGVDTTARAFTSTSFGQQSSTMNFDITLAATSSKVLLIATTAGYVESGQGVQATIFRDSTNLGNATYGMSGHYTGSYNNGASISIAFIDSPSSTSAITYSFQFKGNDGTNKQINHDGIGGTRHGVGTLIGLEIGA